MYVLVPVAVCLNGADVSMQPIHFGFEDLIKNKLHTLHVPSGPGYEGISIVKQTCATVNSIPGQATMDGNRYVALLFVYYFMHLWCISVLLCMCLDSLFLTSPGSCTELRHPLPRSLPHLHAGQHRLLC